ncbi:MAG: serine hydrolase [Verrucomicrobia subdivision 3 bacterium]|nr:serine hydrolase [Limisphaerales bacterium]
MKRSDNRRVQVNHSRKDGAVTTMKLGIAIIMLSSLASVCASLAEAETDSARGFRSPAEMEAFVDGVIAAQLESLHIPGAAVAVVADGKVYFAKGYGYADLEKGRKVDPEATLFLIGSVIKLLAPTLKKTEPTCASSVARLRTTTRAPSGSCMKPDTSLGFTTPSADAHVATATIPVPVTTAFPTPCPRAIAGPSTKLRSQILVEQVTPTCPRTCNGRWMTLITTSCPTTTSPTRTWRKTG